MEKNVNIEKELEDVEIFCYSEAATFSNDVAENLIKKQLSNNDKVLKYNAYAHDNFWKKFL